MRFVDRFVPTSRRAWLIVATLAVFVLAASAWTPGVRAQEPSPTYDPAQVTVPLAPPSARAGRPLYLENCAPCHGDTGNGDGPTAPELTAPPAAFADPAAIWDTDPGELFHTTKFGRMSGMMPPWRNRLNDGEIWDAVAYAWSLHTSEQQVAQGAVFYEESCAACHGAGGQGDGPDAEGDLPDFGDQQYVVDRSQADWQAGWQQAHPEIGGDWSSNEQAATLEYIRTFSIAPPWQTPYQPGEGLIRGRVTQGTDGGADAEGMRAMVDAYLGFDRVATFTTTVAADGTFTFRNLATDPSLNYIASVAHDGISYSSDFLALSPITTTVETALHVYETTDDPTVLVLDRLHWIVETQPGALLIGQIYAVGNTSDRTFVGRTVQGANEPVTVAMQVPPGAQNVTFDSGRLGDRFIQVGPVIFDTLPVLPGQATRQVIVRYALFYEDPSLTLNQELLYPAGEVSLLVTDMPDLRVDASGVQFVSVESMGDRTYQFWAAENVAPTTLEVRFDGLLPPGAPDPRAGAATGPQASTAPRTVTARSVPPPLAPWASGLLAGIVFAALLGFGLWVRSAGTVRSSYTRENLTELRETLLDEIAHLDDLHALGDVSENEWMSRRAQLKAQLVDVVARLGRGKQKS
jgi:mono/diheme cytochrome c family protein